MTNITIIGAGNIGSAILAILSQRENISVTVYSTKKHLWSDSLKYKKINSNSEWKTVKGFYVTDKLEEAVKNANQILITLPSFMREKFMSDIKAYINPDALIVFIPGCGGIEFFCRELIEKNYRIIGFERVPAVSRIKEYGKSVEFECKKSLRIAGLNLSSDEMKDICEIFSYEFGFEFIPLSNYLAVTLTPANPIMHPARLYSMFKDKNKNSIIDHNILFYGEWDNETSKCLLKCDEELQELCSIIGVDEVKSLKEHYEAYTAEQMTEKLKSILSFKNIYAPLKCDCLGNFKVDLESRYFMEDFPFGLFIIKGLCDICNVKADMIDAIINWYLSFVDKPDEYYNIPYKNGIKTINDIRDLYMKR